MSVALYDNSLRDFHFADLQLHGQSLLDAARMFRCLEYRGIENQQLNRVRGVVQTIHLTAARYATAQLADFPAASTTRELDDFLANNRLPANAPHSLIVEEYREKSFRWITAHLQRTASDYRPHEYNDSPENEEHLASIEDIGLRSIIVGGVGYGLLNAG